MSFLSVITVNYRQSEYTNGLLRSIKQTACQQLEVIVVDNGSEVDNGQLFRSIYPSTPILRSEKNLGFAGGNNLGIEHATGDYLLFLNNDTEITAGFIETRRDELDRHPDIGLLSPLILYHEDKHKIQYAGYT